MELVAQAWSPPRVASRGIPIYAAFASTSGEDTERNNRDDIIDVETSSRWVSMFTENVVHFDDTPHDMLKESLTDGDGISYMEIVDFLLSTTEKRVPSRAIRDAL